MSLSGSKIVKNDCYQINTRNFHCLMVYNIASAGPSADSIIVKGDTCLVTRDIAAPSQHTPYNISHSLKICSLNSILIFIVNCVNQYSTGNCLFKFLSSPVSIMCKFR